MGYSEDMAAFIQYRAGTGLLSDIELAMLIYRLVIGGGGGGAPATSLAINDGATIANKLAVNAQGEASVIPNLTALINNVLSGVGATGVKLDVASINSQRDTNNLASNTTFTIGAGASQTDWKTISSPHKLLLLEVPVMSSATLQVRWRHPITTGATNLIVDAFGTALTFSVGTARTFSSDALAPLARCALGDGEISFISNLAEGSARSIKLYH